MISWDNSDYLAHYGMPRRSGRYPYGSGKNPYRHNKEKRKYSQKNDPYFKTAASMRPGGVIKKGSELYRIAGANADIQSSGYKHDPLSGDIKYVSTNPSDATRWKNLFYGRDTSVAPTVIYETNENIKVMSAQKAAKKYSKIVKKYGETGMKEVDKFFNDLSFKLDVIGAPKDTTVNEVFGKKGRLTKSQRKDLIMLVSSRAIQQHGLAGDTETGMELIKQIYNTKYSAVEDALGWNVAVDPIIVFNPRKSLKTKYDGPGKFK